MTERAVRWSDRWPPLEPSFMLARGPVATRLADRLLARPGSLSSLRGVVGDGLLAVTGEELPWVEGVAYFGRPSDVTWLLVPTHRVPEVPVSWLERAYRAQVPGLAWPCLLTEDHQLIAVGAAAPFDSGVLAAQFARLAPVSGGGAP